MLEWIQVIYTLEKKKARYLIESWPLVKLTHHSIFIKQISVMCYTLQ